jgi:hypothetical protein
MLIFSCSRALADEPRVQPPPASAVVHADTPAPRKGYGGQTLIVEGVSIAAVAAALAIESPLDRGYRCSEKDSRGFCIGEPGTATSVANIFFYGGVAGYMLGPPIVHIAHDRVGMAGASLGIRFVPPILLVMGRAMCLKEWPCMLPGLASVVGVAALDAAVFARENEKPAIPAASFAPWIDPRGRAGGFSLSGTF